MKEFRILNEAVILWVFGQAWERGAGCIYGCWLSEVTWRSLDMQCCLVEITGKGESNRFWKGEGNSRTGSAQWDGRAGGYEGLVCGSHPLLSAWGRDMRARFMKVKLSSQTERQNWAFQGTAGKLGDLSRGRGVDLSQIWQVTSFFFFFKSRKRHICAVRNTVQKSWESQQFGYKN